MIYAPGFSTYLDLERGLIRIPSPRAALFVGATLSSIGIITLAASAAATAASPAPSGVSVSSVRGVALPEPDVAPAAPPADSTPSTATVVEAKCILLAKNNDSSPTLVSA